MCGRVGGGHKKQLDLLIREDTVIIKKQLGSWYDLKKVRQVSCCHLQTRPIGDPSVIFQVNELLPSAQCVPGARGRGGGAAGDVYSALVRTVGGAS